MNWFDVDKAGLAALLERRGKSFVIFELIQNCFDASAKNVSVTLTPTNGVPQAQLVVEDDGEGFADLSEAFTLFSKSRRGNDSTKRGRFNLGEKLVIALCSCVEITSTCGSIQFDSGGRRKLPSRKRDSGTQFDATMKITRDELTEFSEQVREIICPAGVSLIFNGERIERPKVIASFRAKLQTEIDDGDGLRKTTREASVEAFEPLTYGDECTGQVLEMGIPIQRLSCPWRLNVSQKVPMGFDRDAITDSFRRALQVAAVNAMANTLDKESAAAPWAREVAGDARITKDALSTVSVLRFGERAVMANPSDPTANANAAADGCELIYGGSLSAAEHANIRKHALIPASSRAYPTATPAEREKRLDAMDGKCPMCGQVVV